MSVNGTKINALSIMQLNELLEDDEKLNQMVQETDEVQNVQLTKEMTLVGNRRLAEENLQHQPKLDCLKIQLVKRYQELQTLFESYQMRKAALDNQTSATSIDTLLALLQTEGAKIEEETENMAECFLEGETVLDAFIDEYQSKRKLAHLRRVKIEKLQEIVLKGPHLPLLPVLKVPEKTFVTPGLPAVQVDSSTPPVPMPRRAPPPPPAVSGGQPMPFIAAAGSAAVAGPPNMSYPSPPYPPIPPRTGHVFPSHAVAQGYPTPFVPQYPPALPQRPARLPSQPGFIIQ
ncbi:VPS37B subunit of ESCRT-I a [Polypterus senegalus]